MLGSGPALGQAVPPATTNTATPPTTNTVGPRDLQNFNLGGTVTRPAQQPANPPAATAVPARREAPPRREPSATDATTTAPSTALPRPRRDTAQQPILPPVASPRVTAPQASTPSSTLDGPVAAPTVTRPVGPTAVPAVDSPSSAADPNKLPLWPWLLAALALGAGGAFLFWRSRAREGYAGGAYDDDFVAPDPVPTPARRPATVAPRSAPIPPPAAPATLPLPTPSIPGTVTTRLRPRLEMEINPLRFIVNDQQIAIELELQVHNAGNAPAQAVLLEAKLLNAANDQDQQLTTLFANPVGKGERIVVIPPQKRVGLTTQVAVGREHVQQFEIAGRRVSVPVLALTALYQWSGGQGQTSVSYLLGRISSDSDKLAPFRLDLGPRLFRQVGARLLPTALRT
ncbi:MAG: hypothetical protein ABIR86_01070 [Sphingomicrobium sp.]